MYGEKPLLPPDIRERRGLCFETHDCRACDAANLSRIRPECGYKFPGRTAQPEAIQKYYLVLHLTFKNLLRQSGLQKVGGQSIDTIFDAGWGRIIGNGK
jgi:hypothetical protein